MPALAIEQQVDEQRQGDDAEPTRGEEAIDDKDQQPRTADEEDDQDDEEECHAIVSFAGMALPHAGQACGAGGATGTTPTRCASVGFGWGVAYSLSTAFLTFSLALPQVSCTAPS